ncbi:MAG: hypothetical protein AAF989_11840 [Planctomycetota bacterium]
MTALNPMSRVVLLTCILIAMPSLSEAAPPVSNASNSNPNRENSPQATSSRGKVVFEEDFEDGTGRWDVLDPETWTLTKTSAAKGENTTFGITARKSDYVPPHRSPFHVALIKDIECKDFEISFRVRSTLDTGNHRDCCVFFNYQDDRHFYYVHLGAKPDPHSGQIMIVNDAPRLAMTANEKKVPWDNDWHHVRGVRRSKESTIDVFFDDMSKPHMSVKDDTFVGGRMGIGSFDDLNEFDDLVVRCGIDD